MSLNLAAVRGTDPIQRVLGLTGVDDLLVLVDDPEDLMPPPLTPGCRPSSPASRKAAQWVAVGSAAGQMKPAGERRSTAPRPCSRTEPSGTEPRRKAIQLSAPGQLAIVWAPMTEPLPLIWFRSS